MEGGGERWRMEWGEMEGGVCKEGRDEGWNVRRGSSIGSLLCMLNLFMCHTYLL